MKSFLHWFLLAAGFPAINSFIQPDCHRSSNTSVYFNIQYATAERFGHPRAVDNLRSSSHHGPGCIQFGIPPPYNIGFDPLLKNQTVKEQSEDCLSLDVYVPDGDHEDLPVLFYTPGGGFVNGASYIYDMRPLVERSLLMGKPIVAVAINYRLGPLGFLNTQGAVNLGLLDQFEALRWVHRHISKFGGDPDKLVIMGESAGAESTMHQLLSTETHARGAWMASVPSASPPFILDSPTSNDNLVRSYAKACGCPSGSIRKAVDCLRTVNTTVLVAQSNAWQGSGVGFGGPIKQNVFKQLENNPPKIPTVMTSCRDEGTSAAIGFNSSTDQTTSIAILGVVGQLNKTETKQFVEAMLKAYPDDPALGCPFDGLNTTYGQPSQFKRMAAIFTDTIYAEAWTEYLRLFPKVWGMLFAEPIPGTKPAFGVQHGSDLMYYFPAMNPDGDPNLIATMQSALIRFVHDLDPGWGRLVEVKVGSTKSIDPIYRPGFDVIREYVRPQGAAA